MGEEHGSMEQQQECKCWCVHRSTNTAIVDFTEERARVWLVYNNHPPSAFGKCVLLIRSFSIRKYKDKPKKILLPGQEFATGSTASILCNDVKAIYYYLVQALVPASSSALLHRRKEAPTNARRCQASWLIEPGLCALGKGNLLLRMQFRLNCIDVLGKCK